MPKTNDLTLLGWNYPQPDEAPQVSHLQHEPLRISVNWPHSVQGSPS